MTTAAVRTEAIAVRGSLSRPQLHAIADGARVRLGREALERMRASHEALLGWLREGRHVYGASSGVGDFRDVRVANGQWVQLQHNIVRSHCCGLGRPLPTRLVRAALALRMATFARGYSGVRPALAQQLATMLNARIHPVVPEHGSVGASGDPVLLAHLALGAIGEGRARVGSGQPRPTREALMREGIEPITLVPREGLALINGLDFTIALAALVADRARRLLGWGDVVAALTLDALRAADDPFDATVQALRGDGCHRDVAATIRRLRAGGRRKRGTLVPTQDPYCLRCVPQVHGASWTALHRHVATVDHELDAVIDNPLILAEAGAIRHCGHFHGQELAFAADGLALGLVNLANIAQARLSLLLRGTRGLPAMLTQQPGANSGLMMLETLGAAIIGELRASAAPLSVHNVAASSEQEDHTSMAWAAMRRTESLLGQLARVLAAEALAAVTAIWLQGPDVLGDGTRALLDSFGARVEPGRGDRTLDDELEALANAILHETPPDGDGE